MRKKGQTLIFEQVLIFGISVAIFAAAFMLFSSYQNHYVTITSEDHLKDVKDYLVSNIVELSEDSELNATLIVDIPTKIGNMFYMINLSRDNLTISLEDERFEYFTMESINDTYELSGELSSIAGTVVIYKTGKSIIIR